MRFGIFFTFHTKNIGFYPSPQYNANGVISLNPNKKFDWVEKNLVTPSLPIGFSYPPKIKSLDVLFLFLILLPQIHDYILYYDVYCIFLKITIPHVFVCLYIQL